MVSILPILQSKKILTIPVFMADLALRDGGKRINMLRVYLYINARSYGATILTTAAKQEMADHLNLTTRSVDRHLKNLCARNWLGYYAAKKRYYLRGFRTIGKNEYQKSRQGFLLDAATQLRNEEEFKAFIAGAYINNLARYINYRKNKEKQGGQEWLKGRSVPMPPSSSSRWAEVSATYIAKALNTSPSTAHEYRKLAAEYGIIEIKRHRIHVKPEQAEQWKNEGDKRYSRLKKQRGRLLLDSSHWIRSDKIHYRRISRTKKKSKPTILPSSHILSQTSLLEKEFVEIPSSLSSLPY